MRLPFLFAALALASLAAAQEPTGPHERNVWDAYLNLRANDDLRFELRGTDASGSVSTSIHAVLYWRLSEDARTGLKSKAQVELDVYRLNAKGEDEIVYRIVGDGTTLYRYDMAKLEVAATTYGFYGTQAPERYVGSDAPKLISQLRAAIPGPAAYVARLLSEVNPAGADWTSRFTSWDPGTLALDFDEAWNSVADDAKTPSGGMRKNPNIPEIASDDVLIDPLTEAPYVRGDAKSLWFFYRVAQNAPRQTMAVHLRDDAADGEAPYWVLDSWRMTKATPGRLLDLALDARPETAPAWAFAPYTGKDGAKFRPISRGR